MKLETGKFYHLIYPTAPLPYVAKLVAVDIGTDDVILEFLVDEREVSIKLGQIKSGEVSLEPKKDIYGGTKTMLNDRIERSLQTDAENKERRAAAAAQEPTTIIAPNEVRLPIRKPQDQESEQANPHINE